MVEFKVKSKAKIVGGQDDHLGSNMISVSLVRTGYRHVSLETYEATRLTPASLFLRINSHQRKTARPA